MISESMRRDLYDKLLEWKASDDRKPLIIRGVRQCGKTYLMKQFGRENYVSTAYLNFEADPMLCRLFDGDLDPRRIVAAISVRLDVDIGPETLIVFDEIQECERAMTSLKSFRESAPEYHVVCAGSLLGLQGRGSFPVGKVSFLDLRPMSFREFVRASNERLYGTIADGKEPDELCREMLRALNLEYLAVGGMPEAVSRWIGTRSMPDVDRILSEISQSYRLDFLKHAPDRDIKKINRIWESVPSQLATENRRFLFGHAVEGARAKDLEDALQWLVDAGMVYRLPRIERIGVPLSPYASENLFKIYMMDVGILRREAGVPASHIMEGTLDPLFRGGFMENYVMCELAAYGCPGEGYWVSGNEAEVDFLVTTDSGVMPIEVKSGERYRAASLAEYIDRYSPDIAVVVSGKDGGTNGTVATVPFYSVWRIRDLKERSGSKVPIARNGIREEALRGHPFRGTRSEGIIPGSGTGGRDAEDGRAADTAHRDGIPRLRSDAQEESEMNTNKNATRGGGLRPPGSSSQRSPSWRSRSSCWRLCRPSLRTAMPPTAPPKGSSRPDTHPTRRRPRLWSTRSAVSLSKPKMSRPAPSSWSSI